VNARELYAHFLDAHGEAGRSRPCSFDDLSAHDRRLWMRLADQVTEEVIADLRERGVMWEPRE
jgi:hypothetical protein